MSVEGIPDMAQHVRLNSVGELNLPLIGTVSLLGLTVDEAQALLQKKYSDGGYLVNPHITLTVKDYTGQGITVLGEVAQPGTYSALGLRRMFDAIHTAGGLTPRSGNKVTITHAGAAQSSEVVTLSSDPTASTDNNRPILPGDTIVVSRAALIYVVGEVQRPGGFIRDDPSAKMTVSMALAMAAGPTRVANLSHAKILRRSPSGLESKDLDLAKIMEAKAADVDLQADDIIFVPASKGKMAAERGTSSVLSMLTNLAIYHF